MEHKNHTWMQQATLLVAIVITAAMAACSGSGNSFEFKDSKEALTACRKELSTIKAVKEASMDDLSKIASRWIVMQDTVFSVISRDTTVDVNSDFADDFFVVADSIRGEITRLALAKPRTMKDVIYFKINTTPSRAKIQASKDYEAATKFYDGLDGVPLYSSKEEAVKKYDDLLAKVGTFKKEGEMLQFIKEEDRCFRSLMKFLYEVSEDDLQGITTETAKMFQQLYRNTQADPNNPINSRVMLFISMRFNRRIVQNAEAVYSIVKARKPLNERQSGNFRWMLLQPYLSIDSYSMALLTSEQEKSLVKIADELPRLLAYVDGKDFDKSPKSETDKLTGVLTEYFLKSYLHQAL